MLPTALAALGTAATLLGCGPSSAPPPERPSLTLPLDLASGVAEPEVRSRPAASSKGAASANELWEASPARHTLPKAPPLDGPDPKPLRSRTQYEFTLLYDQGTVTVERIEKRVHRDARVTPRRVGRWALELCVGREVIERVRFDFPLLAGEHPLRPRTPLEQKPSFAPGARVSLMVSLPESDRATFARLIDRDTQEVTTLSWPPAKLNSTGQNNQPTTGTVGGVDSSVPVAEARSPASPVLTPPAASAGPP